MVFPLGQNWCWRADMLDHCQYAAAIEAVAATHCASEGAAIGSSAIGPGEATLRLLEKER